MKWSQYYDTARRLGIKAVISSRYRYKTARYKTWFVLKNHSFLSKKKRKQEFQKKIQKGEIYFTTELVQTGFSDQLFGFKLLYEVGNSIGLKYIYTPLKSARSSTPFLGFTDKSNTETSGVVSSNHADADSIFNFLGINQSLKELSKPSPDAETYHVELILDFLIKDINRIDTYEKLIESVTRIMIPFIDKNRPTLFILKAYPPFYFSFYKMIPETVESKINYRKFFQKKARNSEKLHKVQDSAKLNIFIHIRQGDTAVIQTPWDTYIPVWYKIQGKFKQFRQLEAIKCDDIILVKEFYSFFKKILEKLRIEEISTHVFSDGFKKAFLQIYKFSSRKDVTLEEINKLKLVENTYDDYQFGIFKSIPNTNLIIGEELTKLYDLIRSFMNTDIIIIGTQQTMIPKLIASYFNVDQMPLLIILYKSKPRYLDYLGIKIDQSNIIQVNINDYDEVLIVNKIQDYLSRSGLYR